MCCGSSTVNFIKRVNYLTCLHKPDFGFALTSLSKPEASLLCSHWSGLVTGRVSGIKSLSHGAEMENDHVELLHLVMTRFVFLSVKQRKAAECK